MQGIHLWGPRCVALGGFAGIALLGPQVQSSTGDGSALAKVIAWLAHFLPLADGGERSRILAAGCAAVALLLLARTVTRMCEPRLIGGDELPSPAAVWAGMAAAAFAAVALPFAMAGGGAGLHGPLLLLLVATVMLADRVARGADGSAGLMLALVAGFGAAAHPAYRWAMIGPLVVLLGLRLRRGARWPLLAPMVATMVVAACYLFGPVSEVSTTALADVALGSTAPVSWQRFLTWSIDTLGVLAFAIAGLGALRLASERLGRWPLLLWVCVALGGVAAAVLGSPAGAHAGGLMFMAALAGLLGVGSYHLGRSSGTAGPFVVATVGTIVAVGPAMVAWSILV